ncbi:proteoglycan 4 [Nematolebias whitei]|uniref:proteoglycan 4 n=1 Tax=Nematolebias whitei TaxID=451745 RepID=UPI00189920DE|nr:proteoglycan 4 [Nematolebias whitei]
MSDIFQPRSLEAKVSEDLSEMTSSPMYTPLIDISSNVKLKTSASTDLPKKMPKPPPPYKPKRPNTLKDVVLTTSQENKQDLQLTPLSQSSSLPASPSPSLGDLTQVSTFKRPPKPLPRTRRHRPEMPQNPESTPHPASPPLPASPPYPERLLIPEIHIEPEPDEPQPPPKRHLKLPPKPPKPVIRLKPKTPEMKPVDPENYVVIEDVLLTGQVCYYKIVQVNNGQGVKG